MTLRDLRVVDLTGSLAGAYCTKLLADAGADVVVVEPEDASGGRWPGIPGLFDFLHTSKRSVSQGNEEDLVRAADIVVAGADFAVLPARRADPNQVIVTISLFGTSGPWVGRAATEFTLQAACGSTGGRGFPDSTPLAGGRPGRRMADRDLRRRRRPGGVVARRPHRRGRPRRRVRPRLHGHRHGHVPLRLRRIRRQLRPATHDRVVPQDRGPVRRADCRRLGELHDQQCAAVRRLRRPHRPPRDRRRRTLRPRHAALRAPQRVLGDDEGLHAAAHVGHRPRGGGSPAHPRGSGARRRDGRAVRAVRGTWGVRRPSLRALSPAPDTVPPPRPRAPSFRRRYPHRGNTTARSSGHRAQQRNPWPTQTSFLSPASGWSTSPHGGRGRVRRRSWPVWAPTSSRSSR